VAQPWPNGGNTAAFVLLHIETLELNPPSGAMRDPRLRSEFGNFFPDYRTYSYLEYGNRIGVFRLLDFLQARGWKVAAAVNGLLAREKPELVRELVRRDVTILVGGWSASRMVSSAMAVDEERELLRSAGDAIEQVTGSRSAGYASQDYGYSSNTPSLLEQAKFSFAVDWPNDESPFAFGPTRKLVMLPVAAELDDAHAMVARKIQPRLWGSILHNAVAYWRENARCGSVLVLSMHPWVAGAAHRFTSLRRALDDFPAQHFWQAAPEEIVSVWRAHEAAH